ncbi:3-hydroxybutyryl-CoA dehydrogenase [Amycolatopsis mediterranei S699]|uniref:3-hydroxybutyryl-CoA dehydrogenase n=2 Tax=Amycolatopsis mediterranei TaxID=33910 RepID=A0A0H3DH48_AMYMU|nr:3-hydroxybutyryl-CoA dehydrogenase [Amycolatopsis mediterranei]ADJ49453.1 3-hydroxybutyryl-CoA dehydrogenase [Amycolatopsis mediterranei U32]AEK46425.1 3-hydroxybutyryl-CoA dehydrogenase [Amycolatopsis mediterranei S699]AFO81161.1 3-hydroxybutyryl-CoA dehydrogenase [Amycolatopsis mediterranei S699]AGT88289.1 3-hydroxybutyryl-CoA dehydrogenase [Amycolatopsis mediterranei RB]KDO12733.1 3-hydroxybutyryl-CoA dehydrogenase [Amycolatopsis mediterranei]
MVRDISTVGVVGLGTMGAGIAEVLARSGLDVVTVELDEAGVARGRGHLEHSTERALSGGKLDAPGRAALLDRIHYSTSLSDLSEVDLVIEAIPESLELKAEVFAELDKITRPEVVFASNTSSLSITEIGVHTARPGKVVGMHFFNPAPVLKLVEIVKTVVTEPDVVAEVVEFAERLGKVPVVIGDRAGFIANALLFGYLNHAVRMYEQRYATREDLDAAMRFGCGYPMGPLALLDLIGLDTANEILDTMYHQSRNRLHAPAPLLKQMITAGLLGRKTGRGFYTYDAPDSPTVVSSGVVSTVEGVPPRPVARVGVVGTGTMATGIAEVFAKRGLDVVLRARSLEKAQASVARVKKSLDKAVVKGKLSEEDAAAALARITPVTDFEALADVDLVIEAVAEELPVKQAVFAALDEVVRPGAVLATTTSSLPVIECAASTSRPSDVVGLHFFNPAPVMKLVEVVSTIATAPDVVATASAVCKAVGKHAVHCGDRAGFIVNALLFPYLNDAVKMLEAHYAGANDIDTAMKVGCGLPMGPFELLDVVGLDVSLAIQRTLYNEFREEGFAPAPLLEHLVTAGRLGRKTGKGFKDY